MSVADPLLRAKTYPYPIPDRSYVFDRGEARFLGAGEPVPDLSGRLPVLAVGSNQSPEQLARKFDDPAWGEIPVLRIELQGYDSVYSPHIAAYGAIAATLQQAPGVTVTLFVTWLDDRQLTRMHETEVNSANYGFGRLDGLEIDCETGPASAHLYLYASSRGTLTRDDAPIPVAEIPARNRRWPAMTQIEVQHLVRDRLSPDADLDDFIHQSVADADLRRQRSDRLKNGARPFDPPDFQAIAI